MSGMALVPLPATTPDPASSPAPSTPPDPARAGPPAVAPLARLPRRRRPRRGPLARGHRVGAWRIDGELGRGGMGSVYAVIHNGFGKRAALKVCHEAILGDAFTAQTFLREARIVHLVDHPGVCDVFATGTHRGRPYLAMERLAGETLGTRLERGPLPREETLELLLEVCDVLGAAHARGVVHRDLKLDNVFLLEAPGAGGRRTKLLDWGVAYVVGEPDPMQGMIAGTLTYVAPEQIRGDALDPAADVYSLGVLAYQLLLGAPPFAAKEDLRLLRMHLEAQPPPPAKLWPEIPAELAAMLEAMLAKEPARRPKVTEVRRALQRARDELRAPARDDRGGGGGWRRRVRGWLARLAVLIRRPPALATA